MKDRSFNGSEATFQRGTCKTYYKRPCSGGPVLPIPGPSPMPPPPSARPAPTPAPPTADGTCYGELAHLAADEGDTIGSNIGTRSAATCQARCSANDRCKSISLCPQWSGCWMKVRSFNGSEATRQRGTCKTYYKKPCSGGTAGPTPVPTTTSAEPTASPLPLQVMSYNTQYSGYPDRVDQFGAKIRGVRAAVVGTQECQDKHALARASGYQFVPGTDFQNPIFFDPDQVSLVQGSGGWMKIPRDDYATRTMTWGRFKFKQGRADFWFFNTHLPHRHGLAASAMTHSNIAHMLLQKRDDLGAESAPTVIVGDMNPFASDGAAASFESTLIEAGFVKTYQGRGNPGFSGLDKIFASPHWRFSNGGDQGTGSSDHTAIAVELTLRA